MLSTVPSTQVKVPSTASSLSPIQNPADVIAGRSTDCTTKECSAEVSSTARSAPRASQLARCAAKVSRYRKTAYSFPELGLAIHSTMVGDTVGAGVVGDVVGEAVGIGVVGDAVGDRVGVAVGDTDGVVLGESVGEAVGASVGAARWHTPRP